MKDKILKKGEDDAKASSELKEVVVKKSGFEKWKKKKWFKIFSPKEFGEKEIGETVAEKPKSVIGRKIKVSLGDLTGQKIQRHIVVFFKVSDVQGDKASTSFFGHEINPSYMGRLLRRRISKIEVVPTVQTKDGRKVRVKAVVVTSKKANAKQETSIRHLMIDRIEKGALKKDLSEFNQELLFGTISLKIFKDAKRIIGIKRTEIVKSTCLN